MELKTSHSDPLEILSSTKTVVQNLKHVSIDEKCLDELAQKVTERFNQGLDSDYELGSGSTMSLEDDLQLVFIEDVVNFCFWPDRGEKKWEVEYPDGNIISGGWFNLVACFKRAMAEGVSICDAHYLSNISLEDGKNLFRSKNSTTIPLLEERVKNMREAGKVLLEHFDGKIINLIKQSDYDAVKIAQNIIKHFPSFRDVSLFGGKEIKFFKRAQICPNDFSYLLKNTENKISNLDQLTAYADYKLPQVLRMFGVLVYTDELASKVDSMTEIEHGSEEEIEIRAAMIWVIELLRQHIGSLTAAEIDNTLWLMSQGIQNETKPFHRSRTIFY